MTLPHPSRTTVRLCTDCRHAVAVGLEHECNHPSVAVWPITGRTNMSTEFFRMRRQWREDQCTDPAGCGPEGLLFEPRQPANPAPAATFADPAGLLVDCVMLKTYSPMADGKLHAWTEELQTALRPEVLARMQSGGCFQLLLWGHCGPANGTPQPGVPVQDTAPRPSATTNPPEPLSVVITTENATTLPATGQA